MSGAPVANWDWLMSGLRVFPDVWTPIEADAERRRDVGYSLMCRIGEQQLVVDALDPVQQNHAAVARHLGLADLD